MKSIDRLLLANEGSNVVSVGNFIWLKKAQGEILVVTDKGESASLTIGDFVTFEKVFTEFFITDISGVTNQLTLNIANGGSAGNFGVIQTTRPSGLQTLPSAVAGVNTNILLLPENPKRAEAIIESAETNNRNTRISMLETNPGMTLGILLKPDTTLFLSTTAAIYAANAGNLGDPALIYRMSYTEYNL